MMRASIVIPHMNQPEFLARCLESLRDQVLAAGAVEAIVVDNGSRQLPTEIVKGYPWARLEQEAEKGPGPARNKGIAVAKSDLLVFIDADCVARADWLPTILHAFENDPSLNIAGGGVRIRRENEDSPTMLEAYESVFGFRQREYIEKHNFSITGNLAMRRAAFETTGPFAGIGIAEDRDWGQRSHAAGLITKYLPNAVVYHPARKTFAELCRKWDRHVVHDFNEKASGIGGRVKWALLILAVMASGIIDVRKIIVSNRVRGLKERALAAVMLFRIRMYRAKRMVELLFQRGQANPVWNS